MKFRKKPVVIEAFQMSEETYLEDSEWPDWLKDARMMHCDKEGSLYHPDATSLWKIRTLGGSLWVSCDDWIIRGVGGGIYLCNPDIFEAAYDAVLNEEF